MRRAAIAALILLAGAGMAAPDAWSQRYPTRPVRLVVGFPPGGATDLVARLMAPKYTELLKQQVVVENRPGANGTIATDLLTQALPDGHTVHIATFGSLVISPSITKVPYDPFKDIAPVAQVVALQNIFIVHPSLPARGLKELIAIANKKPQGLSYASSGVGSPGNLAGELLRTMANANLVHVPYKGGGPAMTDLIAGHVELFVAVISTAVPQVQAGKARALAVTGSRRSAALPDVPTVAETGFKGYEAVNWYGLVVPAKTPRAIVDRLHAATLSVLDSREVKDALLKRGIDIATGSPEAFSAYIRSETDKWRPLIKSLGLK
ncbi:MAG TPA: tripartite tricarboxylate transporter substrate binding protein [Burkholderiales bacterium]|nr:tripartite tricarboxylate transporter substrate binding protein [Burkholderiales bacterium]